MNDAAGAPGPRDPHRGDPRQGDPHPRRTGLRALPRWAPLPLGAGLGLACGLGYGLTATPQYNATAYVMVVPGHDGDPAAALGFAQAYGRIVTGSAVLAGAQAATGTAAADLHSHVQAATSPDAPMISVTGTAASGRGAADIADAVAASLAATGNRTAADTGVRLLVFSRATAPTAPSSPSAPLSAAVGASAGGLLAALALLVRRPAAQDGTELPAATATAGPGAGVPGPSAEPVRTPA